jgi:isoleucyl-tRNA synthetase
MFRFVKDADKAIIGKLKDAGRIVNVAVERHSYPFCWRSETPLIYRVRLTICRCMNRHESCRVLLLLAVETAEVSEPLHLQAVPSWFVKVTAIKDRLVANNTLTDWVPSYVKEKRFHNWLQVSVIAAGLTAAF